MPNTLYGYMRYGPSAGLGREEQILLGMLFRYFKGIFKRAINRQIVIKIG